MIFADWVWFSGHCVTEHESGEDQEDWSGKVREDIKRIKGDFKKQNLDNIF